MTKSSEDLYGLECRIFSQHLVGVHPNPYIIRKYQEAHQSGHPPGSEGQGSFDRFLLSFVRVGALTTYIADVYCALFYKGAYFRKKLVLLLAILECAPESYSIIDRPDGCSKFKLLGKCMGRGLSFSGAMLASFVTLLPAHLVSLFKDKLTS